MNIKLLTPGFYGLTTRTNEGIESFQRHVKDNLIQIDFKVKQNRMPKFGQTIKLAGLVSYWIETLKITQAELARRMNVSPSNISQIVLVF